MGDGTTILHGVTLGGTGKDHGDRHPKVGKDVLIGAGTKILGNITVGDRAKIGAGSVVLRPIPSGATAVGAPAKIIGFTPLGEKPGSTVDMKLEGVEPLLGKKDSGMLTEGTTSSSSLASTAEGALGAHSTKEALQQDAVDGGDAEESTGSKEGDANDKDSSNEESEEDGEDNEVTEEGTPAKCRWKKVAKHNDGLCPFAGSFRDISKSLKQCSISHAELRELLIQEGCTEGECVEVFFELLHCTPASSKARQCGCIPSDIFASCFPEIARYKTRLDSETIQALAAGDLRALGMSKKASKRFKNMFNALGRNSVPTLPRIPSSGTLPTDKCPLRKSEILRMTPHLDTAAYAEGIDI